MEMHRRRATKMHSRVRTPRPSENCDDGAQARERDQSGGVSEDIKLPVHPLRRCLASWKTRECNVNPV